MSLTLTITGESPAEILAQVRALAGAVASESIPVNPASVAPAERRGPGRPRKTPESPAPVASEPAPAPELPAEVEPAPQQAEVAAPAAAVAPPARPAAAPLDGQPVTKEALQKVLVAIAQSGPDGRSKVSALCVKYGAKNLSAIPPTSYAALLADSNAVLSEIRESQGG